MSKLPRALTSRRGPLVLMVLVIIVLLIVMGTIMSKNRNFNDDRVKGNYSGNINFEDYPPFPIRISADGEGNFNGTFYNTTALYPIEGYYECIGLQVGLYFFINDTQYTLLGDLNEDYSVIMGDSQWRDINNNQINGTFLIQKL
jgi:hypothetical protein